MNTYGKIFLTAVCLLLAFQPVAAQVAPQQEPADSVVETPEPYFIGLLSRGYNDRIVLRWAPSEYVPWHVLNSAGYVVQRIDKDDNWKVDTLAIVKPWSIEKFKQTFSQEDSLAGVAVQLIYGGPQTRLDNTKTPPGSDSMGGIVEVYEEQQSVLGLAMMVAELRPDLAEAMGLSFTDRTAKSGKDYSYIVSANIEDSIMTILNMPVMNEKRGTYKPEAFDMTITDSLSLPMNVSLYWPQGHYSAYDIERQDGEGGVWRKLNSRPYVPMTAVGNDQLPDNGLSTFRDVLPKIGTYHYRLYGYDSFGDRTQPSPAYKVVMPDMVPPMPPTLKNIVVEHPDEKHAYATIYFHVDTVEADLKGYLPLYRHDRVQDGEWHELTKNFTAPGDSVMRVDVSGLPSGQLSIAAYDQAGNQGASLPHLILLEDFLPPSPPTGLKANVYPDGYLHLRWSPSPESDVAYYEVFAANDLEEMFMNRSGTDQVDTLFVDSLALGLNQAYIYYKVRAVDYSGNSSKDSEVLRVVRPNYIPPSVCRADSVWMTDDAINIWWLQSNEADLDYHRLFRKLETEKTWTLMGVYNADSLCRSDNRIRFSDSPKPNMRTRYVYAMETVNLTGVTSGLSQVQTFLFTGPRIVNISLKAIGDYTKQNKETSIVWETGTVPDYGPWYYCVFRKGPGDEDFKFFISAQKDEPKHTDYLLRPGETAEYYVTIRYEDGRRSQPSNIVKITAPKDN